MGRGALTPASAPPVLAAGDVVLTRSRGIVGWAIRVFTRRIGESRTRATHTALVVEGGDARSAVVVEALHTVKRHSLWRRYAHANKDVAIFRPLHLTTDEVTRVVSKAESYVGRKYGYLKLLAHWVDWILQGAYVFRRLTSQDRYPICSWVVAHSFAAAGKSFGVEPGAATPDDIWDFVNDHPEFYRQLVALGPLGRG